METKTRKIKLRDLIFMNISALYGIRWIAKSTAASFGLGVAAIPMWLIFAVLFFVPQALICAELASEYPSDGGLYVWVKEALGEKYGFMASWLNWTSKLFWYASFMTFFTINIAYLIGKPEMLNNKYATLVCSVIVFVILSVLSCRGMAWGKVFTNTGALGSTIPAVIMILLAFVGIGLLGRAEPSSTYYVSDLVPDMNANSFVAISAIIFGYTGGEVAANFVTEMENPRKNYPKAILISAVLVATIYVIGSIAITMILPTDQIQASTGILDAIRQGAANVGIGYWLVQLVAFGIAFSMLGATLIYIASPIKMLFGSVPKGMFSEKLTMTNKVGIPERAIYLQAAIVSVLLICTSLFPGVDAIYNVLVTMTALTALFPYVLLLISYIKLKKEKKMKNQMYVMAQKDSTCIWIGRIVLALCVVGIVLTCTPVMGDLKSNIIYEMEMIGGGLLVIVTGLLLWRYFSKRIEVK